MAHLMNILLTGQCLFTLTLVTWASLNTDVGYSDEIDHECRPLENDFCKNDIPYNETIFPNMMRHKTQIEAQEAFNEFSLLINTGCSIYLKQFLCFVFAPPCTQIMRPIPVCRSLCKLAASKACKDILLTVSLKPKVLDCDVYPTKGLCIGLNNTISQQGGEDTIKTPTFPTEVYPFPNRDSWYVDEDSYESSEVQSVPLDLILLVTSANKIQLMDIRSTTVSDTMTLYDNIGNGKTSIDYYYNTPSSYIYWVSNTDGKIFRGRLVLDELRDIRQIVDFGSATVEYIAVDWTLSILFWIENFPAAVLRTSSLSGRRVTTVVSKNMQHPIGLTLDPTEGKVFWIDRSGKLPNYNSRIECYSIVTEKRSTVYNITSETISGGGRPKALVADVTGKRLYWIDARSQSLHSIKYDGTDQTVLLRNRQFLREPDSIVVHGNHVIWTDKITNTLMRVNKFTGQDELVIKTFDVYPPQNIRVYGTIKQNSSLSPSYDKASLTDQWQELSSSENMAVHDYDDDDEDDDYAYDRPKKNNNNKHKNSGTLKLTMHSGLYFFVLLCTMIFAK